MSLKSHFDELEILAFELFTPIGNFLHSVSPEIKFNIWSSIDGFFPLFAIIIEEIAYSLKPLMKLLFEKCDFLNIVSIVLEPS